MINSLCGSMGSLKSENSSTKAPPSSPTESISECKRSVVTPSSVLEETGLNLPNIKFELEGDVEVPSPTSSALWESFLTDQLDVDFMICSPVRNFPSPQASTYNYNYNYAHAMHGQSLSGSSPPRVSSTPIGAYSSINKGKGISPLHKVFNSPNNQYMKAESLAALSSMEEFLNDGSEYEAYSMTKLSSMGSSTHGFDMPVMVPEVDTLGMSDASTFSGSLTGSSTAVGSRLTPESEVYDQLSSVSSAPLSQQLQQERLQEKQPQQQTAEPLLQNLNHHMTVPLPLSSEQEADSGLELVHLLLACAEAVAKEEYMLARKYIHHLNRVVTPLGDSMQRVAACFTEALSARLAATLTSTTKPGTSSPKPFSPFPPNQLEILKIFQIVYQACPYIKFAHFTANQAIFEAFEAEERVHVIDLDILEGYQWPAFMQALAARPGGAPSLRITGVGNSMECLKETGRCLSQLAHSLHIPFEFHPVNEELEDLKPYMFNRRIGEALAVNSVNRLHRVVGSCLGSLLAMIRDQAPNILTLVEQEASHNGPYFLGRFLEALHYYSAIFDSLAATFPTESTQRMKVEQYIFAPEIRNIVACEGIERTERHERLEKWRKIMESKGFKGVSLSANAVTQSKILLSLYSCEGYKLTEDGGCLLLGWQDRALIAASAWRC